VDKAVFLPCARKRVELEKRHRRAGDAMRHCETMMRTGIKNVKRQRFNARWFMVKISVAFVFFAASVFAQTNPPPASVPSKDENIAVL